MDGTLHSLRHTFISNLLNEKSVPLPVVMELVGHTKIETTMGYVKTLDSKLKKQLGVLRCEAKSVPFFPRKCPLNSAYLCLFMPIMVFKEILIRL